MQNYYEIIGVNSDSDELTIKNAYLQKVKEYHPDVYDGDKLFAEQMTAKLNEAYNTLKDEESRKIYDSTLNLNINKQKNKKDIKLKKENKFVNFFKRIGTVIKKCFATIFSVINNFFKSIIGGIKNIFKKSSQTNSEQKERKKLNIIILIQTLLIILLIILIIVT